MKFNRLYPQYKFFVFFSVYYTFMFSKTVHR